jgi:hypothetical protein
MITDRNRENTEMHVRENSSNYLPQRDLPMPVYEFQTPNQSTSALSSPARAEFDGQRPVETASLRNFFVDDRVGAVTSKRARG